MGSARNKRSESCEGLKDVGADAEDDGRMGGWNAVAAAACLDDLQTRCARLARADLQSPWPRTDDRPTPSPRTRVTKPLPSRGVPVEPSRVSRVSVVEERSDPVKPPSETCAEVDECSRRPRPGGSGTSR